MKILGRIVHIVLVIAPLALMFYGTFLIHKPSAFIALGALMWIDSYIGRNKEE